MNWHDRITLDPAVMVGKPVIRGTRLTVELIVDLLAQGWTEAQVIEEYDISREDVLACLAYATDMLRTERVFPVSA